MAQLSFHLFSIIKLIWILHSISVTPKMVKKVITNLDLSKASGPDCIPVMIVFYLLAVVSDRTVWTLLELQHLIYPRLLTGFWMLVFFTNLKLVEFQVRYLALFLLFSIIGGFAWLLMGSLHSYCWNSSRLHSWTYTLPTIS